MLWKAVELFWLVGVPVTASLLLAAGLTLHLLGRLQPLLGRLRRAGRSGVRLPQSRLRAVAAEQTSGSEWCGGTG